MPETSARCSAMQFHMHRESLGSIVMVSCLRPALKVTTCAILLKNVHWMVMESLGVCDEEKAV